LEIITLQQFILIDNLIKNVILIYTFFSFPKIRNSGLIFAVLAIKLLPLRKFHLVLVAMNFIGILPISATTTQNLDKLCT